MSRRFSFASLLERLQNRFRRSRAGSVLILCVALLVLLALIGTAMISTSRTDRYSAVQNTTNTQVDLLMEGMKSIAQAAITGDLWGSPVTTLNYRQPFYAPSTPNTNAYDHWDMPAASGALNPANPPQVDGWLAYRFPDFDSALNVPVWRGLTAPLVGPALPSPTGNTSFDSPIGGALAHYNTFNPGVSGSGTARAYPSFIPRPDGSSGPPFPALSATGVAPFYLAGDADGDGIADCGLRQIPGADQNGITYFVGFRIIDNNSAINVNTTWSRHFDFGPVVSPSTSATYKTGDPPQFKPDGTAQTGGSQNLADAKGYFRSEVGLLELLTSYVPAARTSIEMDRLNVYRFGASGTGSQSTSASVDPGGTFTALFHYANQADAVENALSRRLDNPDTNTAVGPYRALTLSDQAALAAGFCVYDRNASTSVIETLLTLSLRPTVPGLVSPYTPVDVASGPGKVATWYNQNFNWATWNAVARAIKPPLRSMLVARNPVSNQIPVVRYSFGPASQSGWTTALPNSPPYVDPLIASDLARGLPPALPAGCVQGMAPYFQPGVQQTGVPVVVKTNINTAPFTELWRAFWSVLADNSDTSTPPMIGVNLGMFRSTLRDVAPIATDLTPSMMLQLRAAIAAANAVDLRDGDDDVSSYEVPLYNTSAATPNPGTPTFTARVYGTEKQPFITEVYVNNWTGPQPPVPPATTSGLLNPNGYIAIEMYNPYPTPIVMNRWAFGIMARGVTPHTINRLNTGGMSLPTAAQTSVVLDPGPPPGTPNTGYYGNQIQFVGGGKVIIPGGQYVVFENYSGAAPQNPGTDATYRPIGAGNLAARADHVVYVPGLHQAMNNELVLVRPRMVNDMAASANGNLTSRPSAGVSGPNLPGTGYYDEGSPSLPNLSDFVPIDSYDFTGITPSPPASGGNGTWWHYVRPNDNAASAWRFVYPFTYSPALGVGGAPRQTITNTNAGANFNDLTPEVVDTAPPANLAGPDTVGSYVNPYPGIQIANHNWNPAVPNNNPNVFPFGGAFARNGDIVQTTFIGAYQIRNCTAVPTQMGPAPATTNFTELNSISMDAAFADDQDINAQEDALEKIGRFCPITGSGVDDHDIAGAYATTWRYHFADKLLDYLTVQSPPSDYEPEIDPARLPLPGPAAVKNSFGAAADPYHTPPVNADGENKIGVEGLININTAPWWVIASLPLLPNDLAGAPDPNNGFPLNTENLARQIVLWRDGDGTPVHIPHTFRSIFDLNDVPQNGTPFANSPPATIIPAFKDAISYYTAFAPPTTTTPHTSDTAITSPYVAPPAQPVPPRDFEEDFLMVNRISNLTTVRSDSFTVYIIIQGWRNAGQPAGPNGPSLAVQRRAAMIVDRSGVTGASGGARVSVTPVPTN